ncbi:hypothetical protein PHMEG_00013694 [Phytophthora megakarya]|uniref:Uncharacterized protein n=1 Tax=Phytophthora megakarya TaxID=4795 RepID=A0A225W7A9_9STRA|nr:hypothetical protein PHMEG_00013694 [Phytophthora megakarya]
MESEERLAAARVGEANAQAKKLQEEAEHWRQQRKIMKGYLKKKSIFFYHRYRNSSSHELF